MQELGSDAEWEQFRALDLMQLKAIMSRPVVVNLRNIYRPEKIYSQS
jgi:UDPglucose 6-dehydrogenase